MDTITKSRIQSIDILRGIAMILMALDMKITISYLYQFYVNRFIKILDYTNFEVSKNDCSFEKID